MAKFKNHKEFEFKVWKELVDCRIPIQPLDGPFDSESSGSYLEFKMSKFNPKYHCSMIEFTNDQSKEMRSGNLPIVLVDGEDGLYFLSPLEVKKELVDHPERSKHETIWAGEVSLGKPLTFEQIIERLVNELKRRQKRETK